MKLRPNYNKRIKISLNSFDKLFQLSTKEILLWFLVISTRWWRQNSSVAACARALFSMSECLAEKRRVSPYNAIWWCRQQTLRKLMKNMTRKSWIFWNWQSLPELSDLEKSDLKIRSRSVKKRSTIRSRSWSADHFLIWSPITFYHFSRSWSWSDCRLLSNWSWSDFKITFSDHFFQKTRIFLSIIYSQIPNKVLGIVNRS